MGWSCHTVSHGRGMSSCGCVAMYPSNKSSVVLWLLPVAYVCAINQIAASRRRNPSATTSAKTEYQAVHQLDPAGYRPQSYDQHGYTNQGYGHQFEPLKQPFIDTTPLQTKSPKGVSFFFGIALGVVAVIMWCVTVMTLIFHWQSPTTANQRTESYLQDLRVTADPSVLGDLPTECVNFITSTNLQSTGIYSQSFDRLISAGFATLQFIIVSSAAFTIGWRVLRRSPNASVDSFKSCLQSTIIALVIAVIGTAIYIGIMTWQKHSVNYSYTTNITTTGGCTFAFIQMDGALGYWDVPYELGFRIGMSVLGAA